MPDHPTLRRAGPEDAETIAALHAESWRRHYRGAYTDAFLDGDVVADRRAVWTARLRSDTGTATILAERDGDALGFVHADFDTDPRWGSLVDNLHVNNDVRRTGIGTVLLREAARAIADHGASAAMYLWVLEQNTAAQAFYQARGAVRGETIPVPPGDDPARLNGSPRCTRMLWPDVTTAPRRSE